MSQAQAPIAHESQIEAAFSRSPARYGGTLIALHWATLLLLIGVYATMELRGLAPRGEARDAVKALHSMLGLTVLFLVPLRLLLRVVSAPPSAISPPIPAYQLWLSRLLHVALYAFMVVMPLTGWLMLGAKGATVPFWGFTLPSLSGPDRAMAGGLEEVHEALATVGYVLIGLHAAAALFHHYIRRDDTLRRILPARSRS